MQPDHSRGHATSLLGERDHTHFFRIGYLCDCSVCALPAILSASGGDHVTRAENTGVLIGDTSITLVK